MGNVSGNSSSISCPHTAALQAAKTKQNPAPAGSKQRQLLDAAKAGNQIAIQELLRTSPDLRTAHDADKGTAAYFAASEGHLEALRALHAGGCPMDEPNLSGATPLFVACFHGEAHIARFLLAECGADATHPNARHTSPVELLALGTRANVPLLRVLAVECGVNLGAPAFGERDPNAGPAHPGRHPRYTLAWLSAEQASGGGAREAAAVAVLQLLGEVGGGAAATLDARVPEGIDHTPAAAAPPRGPRPMHAAARAGAAAVVRALHELGVSVDHELDAEPGNALAGAYPSPMHAVCASSAQRGSPVTAAAAARALHACGGNLELRDASGATPLLRACLTPWGVPVLAGALLELGADPNAADAVGCTPALAVAGGYSTGGYGNGAAICKEGVFGLLRALAGAGADMDAEAEGGATAMLAAAFAGNGELCEVLADCNATIDNAHQVTTTGLTDWHAFAGQSPATQAAFSLQKLYGDMAGPRLANVGAKWLRRQPRTPEELARAAGHSAVGERLEELARDAHHALPTAEAAAGAVAPPTAAAAPAATAEAGECAGTAAAAPAVATASAAANAATNTRSSSSSCSSSSSDNDDE
jgi:ankyrin repeat protein